MSEIKDKNYADVSGDKQGRKLIEDKKMSKGKIYTRFGILLPKFFWHTVRKNCCSDQEKLLKFEAEGREFSKVLKSVEQFIQTVKGQNIFW